MWVESNESAGESTLGQVCVFACFTERNYSIYRYTCTFSLGLIPVTNLILLHKILYIKKKHVEHRQILEDLQHSVAATIR